MKKLLLLIGILLIGLAAFGMNASAQNESAWNVHVGWNLASENIKGGGVNLSTDSHSQFQVGFSYSLPLSQNMPLYLSAGLDFTGRGGQTKVDGVKASDNLYYLQLPVTVGWHFDLSEWVSIRPEVGVWYAAGLFSNSKVGGEAIKDESGDNYDFFSEYTDGDGKMKALKTSDFGLRFGVDVALKEHYSIGLGYDLGLMNINKDMFDSSVKVRNGVFYIRAGYNF